MTPTNERAIIGAVVTISVNDLQVGGEYLVTASEYSVAGKLLDLFYEPHLMGLQPGSPLAPQAGKLALMQIQVPSACVENLIPHGHAHQVFVSRLDSTEQIATGLALHPRSLNMNTRGGVPSAASGLTVWLTGLSGAGKTTLARGLELRLRRHFRIEILDADIVRTHLCKGLGFTKEDRTENIRRIAFLAELLTEAGALVLVSAISPYRATRDEARETIGRFLEVYVNAPLSTCEARDVKGLYKRAREGQVRLFTGVHDTYEPPLAPDVECCTAIESIDGSVTKIIEAIRKQFPLPETC